MAPVAGQAAGYESSNQQDLVTQLKKQQEHVTKDFYHKGWRGEAPEPSSDEDPLQVVLKESRNGRDLHEALKRLLESGGDERSITDPRTGLTKYHTPTEPCHGIHRSCCTSNVPDEQAFLRGIDTLRQLQLEAKNMSRQKNHEMIYTSPEDLFRKLLCDLRERIRAVFELSFEDVISLFPSGTDAELMPALLAYARASVRSSTGNCGRGHEVCSIVTASGEVGSGTTLAAIGQHFAKRLPSGKCPSRSNLRVFDVEAEEDRFSSINLYLRDSSGRLLSAEERDQRVEQAVERAYAAKNEDGNPRYGCIVVHMVLGSKTGQCMPSFGCLDRIVSRHGDLILPVVDACQGRLSDGIIRECLDKGRMVLCTGSKFFGGPPFSGVCLMSETQGQELELLLTGGEAMCMIDKSKLKEYVVASLLSDDLPHLRALLPQRPLNYGVLMRWTLALHGMETFMVDVPSEERMRLMVDWTKGVRRIVKDLKSPLIELLEDGTERDESDELSVALSTIVSFHCRCNRGSPETAGSAMTMDELRHVQFLMASDLGQHLPHLSLLGPARTRCFMGQPVDLAPAEGTGDHAAAGKEHILRVAASAPLVVRMWREGLDKVLAEDRALFEKLVLVLGNWYHFRPGNSSL